MIRHQLIFILCGILFFSPAFPVHAENPRAFLSSFYKIDVFDPPPSATDLFFSRARDQAPHQIRDHHGRWVVLNLWATWCAPCIAELPTLNRLARDTDDDIDILAVSIDRKFDADRIAYYLKRWRVEAIEPLHDTARMLDRRLDTTRLPVTYLIDPAGTLRAAFYGRAKWDSASARAFLTAVRDQPDFFFPYVKK